MGCSGLRRSSAVMGSNAPIGAPSEAASRANVRFIFQAKVTSVHSALTLSTSAQQKLAESEHRFDDAEHRLRGMFALGDVVQAANDKQQLEPMLAKTGALPEELGEAETMLADNGYFSEANVKACGAAGVEPLIALGRDAHHQ